MKNLHISKSTILPLILCIFLAGCSSSPTTVPAETGTHSDTLALDTEPINPQEALVVGAWVQYVKNKNHDFEGFILEEDGTAASINQQDYAYENWKMGDGAITLSWYIAKDKKREKKNYQIVTLTHDSLVLDDRKGEILTFYKLGE